ncbi:hypothetical protein SLE2022_230800 [Rubroshorea leprosula]
MDNLIRRYICVDSECPMCKMEQESILHYFVTCFVARVVWLGFPLTLQLSELQTKTFVGMFDHMLDTLTKESLELFCVVGWKLWGCRNDALWNGRPVIPLYVIE